MLSPCLAHELTRTYYYGFAVFCKAISSHPPLNVRVQSHLRLIRRELLRERISPPNRENGYTSHYWTFQSMQKVDQIVSVNAPTYYSTRHYLANSWLNSSGLINLRCEWTVTHWTERRTERYVAHSPVRVASFKLQPHKIFQTHKFYQFIFCW